MDAPATLFTVVSDSAEHRLRLGLWALTAASVGERVEVLLTAGPLRRWVEGRFDEGLDGLPTGVPKPTEALALARTLAPVRVTTCDTERLLSGLDEVAVAGCVDAMTSLPSLWRETKGARSIMI